MAGVNPVRHLVCHVTQWLLQSLEATEHDAMMAALNGIPAESFLDVNAADAAFAMEPRVRACRILDAMMKSMATDSAMTDRSVQERFWEVLDLLSKHKQIDPRPELCTINHYVARFNSVLSRHGFGTTDEIQHGFSDPRLDAVVTRYFLKGLFQWMQDFVRKKCIESEKVCFRLHELLVLCNTKERDVAVEFGSVQGLYRAYVGDKRSIRVLGRPYSLESEPNVRVASASVNQTGGSPRQSIAPQSGAEGFHLPYSKMQEDNAALRGQGGGRDVLVTAADQRRAQAWNICFDCGGYHSRSEISCEDFCKKFELPFPVPEGSPAQRRGQLFRRHINQVRNQKQRRQSQTRDRSNGPASDAAARATGGDNPQPGPVSVDHPSVVPPGGDQTHGYPVPTEEL
mmetsp:Transcript_3264/g.9602  ORF Transcript_3264/g.9602 Transcript_3264/m.9602 type:complete len:399 (-) Transcript_3264:1020-2216(-)